MAFFRRPDDDQHALSSMPASSDSETPDTSADDTASEETDDTLPAKTTSDSSEQASDEENTDDEIGSAEEAHLSTDESSDEHVENIVMPDATKPLDPRLVMPDADPASDNIATSRATTEPLYSLQQEADQEQQSGDQIAAELGHDNADAEDEVASSRRLLRGLAVAAQRDVGRMRQNNQDSILSLLTTLPRESDDLPLGLFVVADGMGGHDSGEVASRLAVQTVMQYVLSQLVMPILDNAMFDGIQSVMVQAVEEANHTVWDNAQMMRSDMGTTCTAALLIGNSLYIAHVGDSRAYIRDTDGLRPLTSDHSTVGRLIELGQLDPVQAREHPLRSQLYRTIGQQPEVDVEFVYESVRNSTHLLICSDGLWSMISEHQIEEALQAHAWPQDACDELIALANLAGGEDNISAIVVTLPVFERP